MQAKVMGKIEARQLANNVLEAKYTYIEWKMKMKM